MKQVGNDSTAMPAYLQLRYVENGKDRGWVVEGLLFYKPDMDWWKE